MSEAKQKQWRFEPHNLFGEIGPDGEPFSAYGYLAVGSLPVFEFSVFLEHDPALLASVARKACAADAMYEALKSISVVHIKELADLQAVVTRMQNEALAALSLAEGK